MVNPELRLEDLEIKFINNADFSKEGVYVNGVFVGESHIVHATQLCEFLGISEETLYAYDVDFPKELRKVDLRNV